ncbi:hypothetical protein [Achromobacter deleyi]|uniref:hypothetical protein n=1 Tax=Achromobacter deleyi TaxID=1353891 RepID=UPI001491533A|nr:hypothetical protein [Achromobacter deleyi]QVQ25209.1 hypothetical protein HLG70_20375 [Achromobacter deleyi]UIP20751.1 hypothetical protein LYZ39_27965 [Achromobacter deleyi]
MKTKAAILKRDMGTGDTLAARYKGILRVRQCNRNFHFLEEKKRPILQAGRFFCGSRLEGYF